MFTVAIVGKPNVGKSTLFNRIIKNRTSIVSPTAGTTRDRIYGEAEWLTRKFSIIDTGGISDDSLPFQKQINIQVNVAIETADVIIFLISKQTGVTTEDRLVAKMLKKHANKPIIFAVNKCENQESDDYQELRSLGFGDPFLISAEHGIGTGDLLDAVIQKSPSQVATEINESFKIAIIGQPNVGKSTLVNSILKEERVITSEIANTTRDAINTPFNYNGERYEIIDTAGIRRKGKVEEYIDKISVLKTQQAIEKANMIWLVVDIHKGIQEIDETVGGMIHQANIPAIIIANKWDLIDAKSAQKQQTLLTEIRKRFDYLAWAPVVFISALEKDKLNRLFDTISKIKQQLTVKVSTNDLNRIILRASLVNLAPRIYGKRLRISYATQVQGRVPSFAVFCNDNNLLHFSYTRFLENEIRQGFGLDSVPITLIFKPETKK